MQGHTSNTGETADAMHRYTVAYAAAELIAAEYLSRKPGLTAGGQCESHLLERMGDAQRQTEDVLISTRFDDSPATHHRAGIVHFSKTHAADAELDEEGGIHLIPVRAHRS